MTEEQKLIAINKVKELGGSVSQAAKELNIPSKNLKRWMEVGTKRKEGKILQMIFRWWQKNIGSNNGVKIAGFYQ